ncbi:MAG: hypothetical protein F6K58_15290, partial [Symploca sp. SIO2E9]|nr:hypothetical protein [Symploca sp. SIO2E9]
MGRWGDGERGRWGDGEMGRWGDGEMGRCGDGEMGRILYINMNSRSIELISVLESINVRLKEKK